MKNIIKSAVTLAVIAPALLTTSCLEETVPTNIITNEGLQSSPKAVEALVWEMPAIYNKFNTLNRDEPAGYDWGYGALMHMHDVQTEDMAVISSNYDHFTSWELAQYLSEQYLNTQFQWNLYWKLVQPSNNVFANVGTESDNDLIGSYIGIASAFRAAMYLDIAQTYEFLPNEKTSNISSAGNDLTNYTVPIVTEKTTEEASRNNPRVTHDDMMAFIIEDLDRAEANIARGPRLSRIMPDLAVVYGLKARAYLWDGGLHPESYAKAAEYARMAINKSGATPLTRDQWLSTTDGFNKYNNAWMWCITTTKDDRVVTSGILNWTSWCSNETSFGYAAAGPYTMISKRLYDKIADTDFRKLSYKAPARSSLSGRETTVLPASLWDKLPDYASLKFRPGQGNYGESTIACSVDIPLMRVEEMYLIEAEATAHSNPAGGMQLLKDFMHKYRDANYTPSGDLSEVEEIVLQKRIELWGEGLTFFDVKRLNMSVTRQYNGSNFSAESRFNTVGRPAWMNWVIVQTEQNSNAALRGWNNPSFDNVYKP